MTDDLEQSLADSLETRKETLPYLPELLVDLWTLGSSPKLVVDMLESLKLPESFTRVLDLGCGKGAVAITLAKELGFTALGIDANAAFLKEAERKAEEENMRRTLIGSGDRSQRIRTYNFPQNRVTDHRINLTLYALRDVLEGGLDPVIDRLMEYDGEQRIKSFSEVKK